MNHAWETATLRQKMDALGLQFAMRKHNLRATEAE